MVFALMNIMVYAIILLSILTIIGLIFTNKSKNNFIFIFSVAFILIFITLTFSAQPSNFIAKKLLLFSFYPLTLGSAFLYFEKEKILLSKMLLFLVLIFTFLIFI